MWYTRLAVAVGMLAAVSEGRMKLKRRPVPKEWKLFSREPRQPAERFAGPMKCKIPEGTEEAYGGCQRRDGKNTLCIHGQTVPMVNITKSERFWFEAEEGLVLGNVLQALGARHRDGNNTVFLDIGMNRGVFSAVAAATYPLLSVVSVEPQPECVRIATCTMTANGFSERVKILNAYAQSSAETGTIPTQAQFCDPMYSPKRFPHAFVTQQDVRILPIAHALPPGKRLGAVKVDVEGAELGVLEELLPLLRERRPRVLAVEIGAQFWKGTGDGENECTRVVTRILDIGYTAHIYTHRWWGLFSADPARSSSRKLGRRYETAMRPVEGAQKLCSLAVDAQRVDVLFKKRNAQVRLSSEYCSECIGCAVSSSTEFIPCWNNGTKPSSPTPHA
eukprot:Hpha_TRINITY_DN11041_c0_g2::TRINITY_DN11041_c0_g2_i1::g.92732::m.92732